VLLPFPLRSWIGLFWAVRDGAGCCSTQTHTWRPGLLFPLLLFPLLLFRGWHSSAVPWTRLGSFYGGFIFFKDNFPIFKKKK